MKTLRIFLLIGIIALAVSCNKKTDDLIAPVITLTSPGANQVFAAAANVAITGTITDDALHELRITITNTANNAVLYTKTISVHGLSSYSINENWMNNVAAITNATVKVEVDDHDIYQVEKKVQMILNP